MFFKEVNDIDLGETTVANIFIDIFMPMANGLYVKVYLLGYRQACDPNTNPNAEFIDLVPHIDDDLRAMGKDSISSVGTGGMSAKIKAAMIATDSGADMVIANSKDVNIIFDILNGDNAGTLFLANKAEDVNLNNYL